MLAGGANAVAARFGHRSWVCRRHIVLWPLASVLVPFIAAAEEKVMRVLGFFHGGPATATSFPRGGSLRQSLRTRLERDRLCRWRKPPDRIPRIDGGSDQRPSRGNHRRQRGLYRTGSTSDDDHSARLPPAGRPGLYRARRKLQPPWRQHYRGEHFGGRADAQAAAAPSRAGSDGKDVRRADQPERSRRRALDKSRTAGSG